MVWCLLMGDVRLREVSVRGGLTVLLLIIRYLSGQINEMQWT